MTYFAYNTMKLLSVDDDFARLVSITDDELTFEFTYSISQVDAVKQNALAVNLTVLSRINNTAQTNTAKFAVQNAADVINSVRTYVSNTKNAIMQQQAYVVATKRSDITAGVNNQILSQINHNALKNDIFLLRTTRLAVVPASNAKNKNAPVLAYVAQPLSKYTANDASGFMKDALLAGVDPSEVVNLRDEVVSAYESVAGVVKNTLNTPTNLVKLLNYYTFNLQVANTSADVQDGTMVHVLVNEPDDTIVVTSTVVIPKISLLLEDATVSRLFVKFDLLQSETNVAIDTVTKDFDVAQHVQIFSVPLLPPVVSLSQSATNVLDVEQGDAKATSIAVFKKFVSLATNDVAGYTFIGAYDLVNGRARIPVDVQSCAIAIYRIISVGSQGAMGSDYVNFVVTPSRVYDKSAVVDALQVQEGVRVNVSNIPHNVVSIEFMSKNLTTHDASYKNVDLQVHQVDVQVRSINSISLVDRSVVNNNVYEYAVRLTYASGKTAIVGNATIEFLKPDTNKVFTTVQNLIVNAQMLDVTFDISTTLSDTDASIVMSLLQSQGVAQYDDQLLAQRGSLNNLIAHNVQRVDLTTGERADFGIVTTANFSDTKVGKNAVSQLQTNHKYRYEVTPLLRVPDTLFYNLNVTATDGETKKQYTYIPAKYFNPLTLQNGTLYSEAGVKLLNAKDQMSFGAVGNVVSVQINFDVATTGIENVSASRFDRLTNIVSWSIIGDISTIDHFIVLVENLGMRNVLAKVHATNVSCQLVHSLSLKCTGELTYVIVPVFNDYTIGAFTRTNSVVVEDI